MDMLFCSPDFWYCTIFLSQDVIGSLTWVGFAVTIVGVGFAIVQSSKAKSAADAARNAAQNIKSRAEAVQHSHLNAQLSTLEHVLGNKQFELARLYFGPIKRDLRRQASLRFTGQSASGFDRSIATVRQQIDNGCANMEVKSAALSNALDTLMKTVSTWEAEGELDIYMDRDQ